MAKNKKLEKIKGKSKGFFGEFKDFVLRGNVMDMAIGVIIGGAFQGIVTALTSDFINPLINGLGGAEVGGTIKIYGGQVIKYGDFITAVINFLITSLIIFCLIKAINKAVDKASALRKKEDEEVLPTEKECPYCYSKINIKATRCPHCTSELK